MLLRKSVMRGASAVAGGKKSAGNDHFQGRKCGKKELIILSITLWILLSLLLMISPWENDVSSRLDNRQSGLWCYLGLRNCHRKKEHRKGHNHLLHHIDARLSIFLASHSVWEDIINAYPKGQKKVWNEIISDSESDSDTDSDNEETYKPKRFRLRGKETSSKRNSKSGFVSNHLDESNVVLRRMVKQFKVIDETNAEGDNSINAENSSTHPIFQLIQALKENVPVPVMGAVSHLLLPGQVPDDRHIVAFTSLPNFNIATRLSFHNIYQFFDDLLIYIKSLKEHYPRTVIVWFPPATISTLDQDLQLIFHHLSIHHVMEELGVIVVPPIYPSVQHFQSRKFDSRILSEQMLLALDLQLQFIYKKLILQEDRGDQDALAWHGHQSQIQFVADTIQSLFSSRTNEDANHHHHHDNQVNSLHAHCYRYVNTRKYDPVCMPEPEFRYPLLVTGLGGTGSHFIANQLQDMGFQTVHEGIGRDGAVSWFYSVNDYLLNTTYPFGTLKESQRSFLNPRFDTVVHVIRNPLDQISSFTAHTNKTYDFVLSYMNATQEKHVSHQFQLARKTSEKCFRGQRCHLHFATLTWIYWNSLVSNYADKFYHIEHVGRLLEDLCISLWPKYNDISTNKRCPDERRLYLTRTYWKTLQFYFAKQFFPSYKSHKKHSHFKLSDIEKVDKSLVEEVKIAAVKFNYNGDFV